MVKVLVQRIESVEDHPNADRLSLVRIGGHSCVSAKLSDGNPRYKIGDRALRVPPGSKVPDWLLRKGFFSEEKGKGLLGGPKGNIVEASKVRGVVSEGILFTVDEFDGYDPEVHFCLSDHVETINKANMHIEGIDLIEIQDGDDVADLLEITEAY